MSELNTITKTDKDILDRITIIIQFRKTLHANT